MSNISDLVIKLYKPHITSAVNEQLLQYRKNKNTQVVNILLTPFESENLPFRASIPVFADLEAIRQFAQAAMDRFLANIMPGQDDSWVSKKYNHLEKYDFFRQWLQETIICILEQALLESRNQAVCIARYLLLEELLRYCPFEEAGSQIPEPSVELKKISQQINKLVDYAIPLDDRFIRAFPAAWKKLTPEQRQLSLEAATCYLRELKKFQSGWCYFAVPNITLSTEYVMSGDKNSDLLRNQDFDILKTRLENRQLIHDDALRQAFAPLDYIIGKVSKEQRALPCQDDLSLEDHQLLVALIQRKTMVWPEYKPSKVYCKAKTSGFDFGFFKIISKIKLLPKEHHREKPVEIEMDTYTEKPVEIEIDKSTRVC